MSGALPGSVTPGWLALREPADHAARSRDLAARIRGLVPDGPLVIHDLGSGTGSMARWLAPQLPGPQTWVLHDRDAALLDVALGLPAPPASDGNAVTVQVRCESLEDLRREDLAGAALVTASALIDILTEDEVARLLTLTCAARVPTLIALTVTGSVILDPPHHLDQRLGEAFNDHQRRTVQGRTLLGPDAVERATEIAQALGAKVEESRSPWLLTPEDDVLMAAWFDGWVAAAVEHDQPLGAQTAAYALNRRFQMLARRMSVAVDHADLLVVPT